MSVVADEELELLPGELDDAGGVSAEAGCEMRVFVVFPCRSMTSVTSLELVTQKHYSRRSKTRLYWVFGIVVVVTGWFMCHVSSPARLPEEALLDWEP